MLPATAAAEVRALASALALQAAEQMLVSSALLQEEMAPPEDRRERTLWVQRQRTRRADLRLASVELLRYLQLAEKAAAAAREGEANP